MSRTFLDPYPGARPFERDDHDRFFGRSAETEAIADLWLTNRLTIAAGPVASGKTSLLNAGIVPYVSTRRAEIFASGRISYGSTFPFAALPEHNPYSLALLRSWSPLETPTRLVGLSIRDFVQMRRGRRGGLVLGTIDQVEELLEDRSVRCAHRQAFVDEITDALDHEPSLHLLLVARDYQFEPIAQMLPSAASYEVPTLTVGAAIEAVTRPLEGTTRSFAEEAATKLVIDLQARQDVVTRLPGYGDAEDLVQPSLLQVVCARLWNSLPSHIDRITARDVRLYGDGDTALTANCSKTISMVADEHDMPATKLRSWLLDTFVTEHGTRNAAYEGAVATAGKPNSLVHALTDRHLLSMEVRSSTRWYQLLTSRLIEPLRHARDIAPMDSQPAAYLSAAGRALALGDLDVAERYAEATLRTSSDKDLLTRAEVGSLRGNIDSERGKPAQAEEHYRGAAHLFEVLRDQAAVANQLAAAGQMLLAQDRPEDAVDELRAAASRMPNDPVVQSDLGHALWYLGDNQAAIAIFTRLLRADAANVVALRARGEIFADLGDAIEALRDLDRVTLHEYPAARAARGLALALLGDRPGADREIEHAVAEAPRNGAVLLRAAHVATRKGDKVQARRLARRAADATDPALPPYYREVALGLTGEKKENLSPH
jgi:tetratricopeptide (TPR) repeat protein